MVDRPISTQFHRYWFYRDEVEKPVVNPMDPWPDLSRHFVLYDGQRRPRYALRYNREGDAIKILSLQRLRTQYVAEGKKLRWDAAAETEASRRLQAELGVHPAEYLLTQFLSRMKARIRAGARVSMQASFGYRTNGIVNPLVDRFFKKKTRFVGWEGGLHSGTLSPREHELSLSKRRVREILEAQLPAHPSSLRKRSEPSR